MRRRDSDSGRSKVMGIGTFKTTLIFRLCAGATRLI